MKIWFDITNTPQVHFLLAILNGLNRRGYDNFVISARDFSETKNLLQQKTNRPFKLIGDHQGKRLSKKAIGVFNRFIRLHKQMSGYDISISCGSEGAIWSAAVKRKFSLAFGDNDLARQWTYAFFVNKALFPKSIPYKVLHRQGINSGKLYQYDGFKEHVYIADFKPDNHFLSTMPFREYVVVRPENIMANYVQGKSSKSITPQLLRFLSKRGLNILYLPRYDSDKGYAEGINNIYIPQRPINGLDACYHSNGVFTGAGTFAREAACLGVPSFSFFLGERLLAVDLDLINQGKMFYSRDPDVLVKQFIKSDRRPADLQKALDVNEEVISKTLEFISGK